MNDKYITIGELNSYIKSIFDDNLALRKVYLKGEISNFKNHTRGHLYFTLKDDTSRISAVMFYSSAVTLNFKPEDGMNVLVEGRVSCYPAAGTYQIYVDKMEVDGLGALYIEFEKLKEKLSKEGLFLQEHKKPIPKIPKKVGIVTAPTGAAIKDILSTIKRRFPIVETILFPSLVQGEYAAADIVRQIKEADSGKYDLDVLIVGRGGGSIEDLWAFNEEIVARAIYDANTPIISAVGHEVDFTIADFVADLRAPTPTGAAEMAVPTVGEIKQIISSLQIRLNEFMGNFLHQQKLRLDHVKNAYILKNPLSLYEIKEQKLDSMIESLNNYIKTRLDNYQLRMDNVKSSHILKNPMKLFQPQKDQLLFYEKTLYSNIKSIILKSDHQYKLLVNTLKLVNPLGILEKGYSLVTKEDKIIKTSKDVYVNDCICVRLHEGSIEAIVNKIE